MDLKTFNFGIRNTWLVTGAAGFIGSHLVDFLLEKKQKVIGVDNFINGRRENIQYINNKYKEDIDSFSFYELDIRSEEIRDLFYKVDYVLHQAALGSVPRSFKEPKLFNDININGFINIFNASIEANVKSFVYASSSSVYGDVNDLPQKENNIGNLLSPYALTKRSNEIYAGFHKTKMNICGLRYFNVFGLRQDPNGEYAAVIPKWISNFIENRDVYINGDGLISRDFCYIKNVVQANILAALNFNSPRNEIFNIACGDKTTLNELSILIRDIVNRNFANSFDSEILYREPRKGDIIHSYADINKAKMNLDYFPFYSVEDGLKELISQL
jgi:UDP-N-acetylglucosamine 4-epimerase